MNLTLADGLIYWLYVLLFWSGMAVWAEVGYKYFHRRPCLKIDPWPKRDAIGLAWEHVFLVVIIFLISTQLIREVCMSLKIGFSQTKEIQELSVGMIADLGGKIFAGGLMILLLKKYVPSIVFFEGREAGDVGFSRKIPFGMRCVFIVVILYLAIFPLVNDLLLRLGVFVVQRMMHIDVPERHQAFQLLDYPETSVFIKVGTLLLAAVVSPIVEELFFRGFLQNLIFKSVPHPLAAIGITAFLFMSVHVPMYQQMPSLFALGFILGWSYYRYRSLAVPVLTHILFNSVTLIFWSLGGGE
jgi:membrane protease YdiL (CAAX protease family)